MKIIAFYLPQYHETPHNNIWWGKGFTEWTNVAKAKKLFLGHEQPKIPADLGFYDLRNDWTKEEQVKLAKEAGIDVFCYYHYWFGNGQQELETPFSQVVESGKPDFPFCLCWANESWKRKFWSNDGSICKAEILAEQKYLGEQDDIAHFESLYKAFKDPRYFRINGRIVFMIYKPLEFKNVENFITRWRNLARTNALNDFYFIGYTYNADKEAKLILEKGFDGVTSCRLNRDRIKSWRWFFRKAWSVLFHTPRRTKYRKVFPTLITNMERKKHNIFPTLIPNWDHTPRSGTKGDVLVGATPDLFQKHCEDVLESVALKDSPQLCFIKSWNEWGEGNYMEPDLRYGHGYIKALSNAKRKIFQKEYPKNHDLIIS